MTSIQYQLRSFQTADSDQVNRVALAAYNQYQAFYNDWEVMVGIVSNMSSLAKDAEIIVAFIEDKIVGAVAYVPPGIDKSLFLREWSVIRMLAVDPEYRGQGIGKALAEECIRRAIRDGSDIIALHTSPIMNIALEMYLRLGFQFECEISPIQGVAYGIYVKHLKVPSNLQVSP
jgi:ribosomal protein S18 acetylase RimI-like enzyme